MTDARKKDLISKSLDVTTVQVVGRYTNPRTWGVYRINGNVPGKLQFRCVNHPVREWELGREVGDVSLVALFTNQSLAQEMRRILNREG